MEEKYSPKMYLEGKSTSTLGTYTSKHDALYHYMHA